MTGSPPRPAPVRARPRGQRHGRRGGGGRAGPWRRPRANPSRMPPPPRRGLDRAAARPVHAGRARRRRGPGGRLRHRACWSPTPCWAGRSRSSSAMALFALTAFATGEIADMRRLSRRAGDPRRRRPHRRLRAARRGRAAAGVAWPASSPSGRCWCGTIEQFNDQRHDAMSDGELLRLFERQVLAPVDRAAYRLVLESSRDVGLLTALSPLGLLDGVLVLWRTSILFRAIARLYGMAPGPDHDLWPCSRARSATRPWRASPTWSPTPPSRASAPACSPCSPPAPARVPATRSCTPGSASRRSASAGRCPSWPRSHRASSNVRKALFENDGKLK